MKTHIAKIGNSKGVRIPAYMLKECKIGDVVDIGIEKGKIIISSDKKPREDWNIQLQAMHKDNDDSLLISDAIDLDFGDWEW